MTDCPACGIANPANSKFGLLADKILTSRAALEGERKHVTVLFADVKGSMELAVQVDPEEWHKILDRFFQILTDGPSADTSAGPVRPRLRTAGGGFRSAGGFETPDLKEARALLEELG